MLGPFEVRIDGAPSAIGGPRQRALLAVLALHANEVVRIDSLVDQVWGEHPPDKAVHTVRVFVSRLRDALGGASDRLKTRAPGYVLELGMDELDVTRCERLYDAARTAMSFGDASGAAALLGQAQTLWRGRPLDDFTYEPFAQATIARLEELWVSGREELIEARLALGRHAEVVADLEALVREHPFRERPRAQLMLALYRCGRQVEALQAFREARRTLIDELAVEPSQALRDLEQAILRQDAALTPPPAMSEKDVQTPELVLEPQHLRIISESAAPIGSDTVSLATVRRTATVLVANITTNVGADPERAQRMISAARREVQRTVEYHGGAFIRGSSGDDVGVFGIPITNEDDALRALRAAHEIRGMLASKPDRGFVVRLGVDTGELIAETSNEVFGEPRDRAVGLVHAAQEDDVLIGDETRRLASEQVRVAPALDGAAWRLLAIVDQIQARREVFEAPIFGRDDEMAVACSMFRRAANEQATYQLTVIGEPGIGKSRLASEVTQQLGDQALVLVGHCLSYGDGVAFWPLREALTQAIADESRDAVRDLLEGADDADTVADIAATAMGLASVQNVGDQIGWAFRRLLETLAVRRPVILVVEDAHWGEAPFLDLVEYLIDWVRAPAFVLCLARPELLDARPGWGGGHPRVSSLALSPLDDEAASRLLAHQLRGQEISPTRRAQILETAEGNPLFVEQLLRAGAEDPLWTSQRPIPGTIQSLLAARLDRLGPGERAYIEAAAVIGREFWPAAVLELLPAAARRSADSHLSGLVRRGLIHPARSTMAGEEQLRFHHILISDVAYRSASKALRAELHERFAGWLEMRGPQYDEFVGYHLERAYGYGQELGEADQDVARLAVRAADKLGDAGRRAFSRGDANGSVQLLETAVQLLDAVGEAPAHILVELGSALTESGDFPRAHVALQRAFDHARASGDERQAARASISLSYWRSRAEPDMRVDDMRAVAERSITVFERFADDDGLSRAWHHIAWANWVQSRCAAMEDALERSMRHAERAHVRHRRSQLLTDFARAAVFGPRHVADGIERCYDLLRRAEGDVAASASIEGMLAILEAMDGQFVAARARWHKSKQRLSEHGFGFAVAVAQMFFAFIELFAGEPAAALPEIADASLQFERSGDKGRLSTSAALYSSLLCALGRYDQAQKYSDLSSITASGDDVVSQVMWRGAHARALVNTGDQHDRAVGLADSAVARAERTDFTTLHAGALTDRAEVLTHLSLAPEASRDLDKAAALYASKGVRLDVVAASLAGGRVATLSHLLANPDRRLPLGA